MMGKIIDDRYSPLNPAHLHSPLYGFERIECVLHFLDRNAPCVGGDDHSKTVSNVEFTDHCRCEVGPLLAVSVNGKRSTLFRKTYISSLPFCMRAKAKSLDLCEKLTF